MGRMNLHHQEDSEGLADRFDATSYTSLDVIEGRIKSKKEVPEPEVCEFCGAKLYHQAIMIDGVAFLFAPFAER